MVDIAAAIYQSSKRLFEIFKGREDAFGERIRANSFGPFILHSGTNEPRLAVTATEFTGVSVSHEEMLSIINGDYKSSKLFTATLPNGSLCDTLAGMTYDAYASLAVGRGIDRYSEQYSTTRTDHVTATLLSGELGQPMNENEIPVGLTDFNDGPCKVYWSANNLDYVQIRPILPVEII